MILKELKNGIRVVVVPLKGLRSVTIEVTVKIGAKYESKNEQGMSHFLEHLAFKGTRKRPGAMDIFREMDSKGVGYNAQTGYENTSYSITTVRDNLAWGVEMTADILFESTMPEEEVVKERGVITEEIRMYKDNPMMGMSSEMVKFMYGESKIGCWNISGEEEDVVKVDRKKIVEFRNKYLNTQEMVVTLAGDVKPEDVDLVKDIFEGRASRGSAMPEVEVSLGAGVLKEIKREVEQGHFVMAVPAFGWLDKRKHALRLLNIIMTGNASSRLFEEIRTKRGWAYYVFSAGESWKEAGFWAVQAGVQQENLVEAMAVVEKEMINLVSTVSDKEIERAKTYLRGKVTLNLDDSEFWSGYIGEKLLLEGELVDPEEELKKAEMVTLEEVRDLAESIFIANKIRKLVISR